MPCLYASVNTFSRLANLHPEWAFLGHHFCSQRECQVEPVIQNNLCTKPILSPLCQLRGRWRNNIVFQSYSEISLVLQKIWYDYLRDFAWKESASFPVDPNLVAQTQLTNTTAAVDRMGFVPNVASPFGVFPSSSTAFGPAALPVAADSHPNPFLRRTPPPTYKQHSLLSLFRWHREVSPQPGVDGKTCAMENRDRKKTTKKGNKKTNRKNTPMICAFLGGPSWC